MDQNEWENARVSMDFKLLAHHYMDLDHPNHPEVLLGTARFARRQKKKFKTFLFFPIQFVSFTSINEIFYFIAKS